MVLMTLGDLSIQKPKVENLKIKKYFDEIIFETKDKSKNDFINKLSKSKEKIVIINDRVDQALAMKKVIGQNSEIFLVKGPESNNVEHNEKIHDGLAELVDFCQKLS